MMRQLGVAIAAGLVRGVLIGIAQVVNQPGKPLKLRTRFPRKPPGEKSRVNIIRGDGKGRCGK